MDSPQQQQQQKLSDKQINHLNFRRVASDEDLVWTLSSSKPDHLTIDYSISPKFFSSFVDAISTDGGLLSLKLTSYVNCGPECYQKLLENVKRLIFRGSGMNSFKDHANLCAAMELNSPSIKLEEFTFPRYSDRLFKSATALVSLKSLTWSFSSGSDHDPCYLLSSFGPNSRIWDFGIEDSTRVSWEKAFKQLLQQDSSLRSLRFHSSRLWVEFSKALADSSSTPCKLQHLGFVLNLDNLERLKFFLSQIGNIGIFSLHIDIYFPSPMSWIWPLKGIRRLRVEERTNLKITEINSTTRTLHMRLDMLEIVNHGPQLQHLVLSPRLRPPLEEQRRLVNHLDRNVDCPLETIQGVEWSGSLEQRCNEILSRNKEYRQAGLIDKGQMQPNTAKLFICGDAGVGKSTLRKNLTRRFWVPSFFQFSRSTYGIMLEEMKFGDKKLILCDLAGQPEFHTFHHYFMRGSDKDLFLIVCRAPESDGNLETELRYWLRFIVAHRSLSEQKPNVMIIVNFFPDSQRTGSLKDHANFLCESVIGEYSDHISFGPSARENVYGLDVTNFQDVQVVKPGLGAALDELLENRPKVPKVCEHIVQRMQTTKGRVLSFKQFKALCGMKSFNDDLFKACIMHLHDSGDVVFFEQEEDEKKGDDERFIIVDVQWFMKDVVGIFLPRLKRTTEIHQAATKTTAEVRRDVRQQLCDPDHIDYILFCLQNMGVALPDKDGKNITVLPLLHEKLGQWKQEAGPNSYSFWGRRFECKDSSHRLLPFGIFNMLQVRLATIFSLTTMGKGWLYLVEDRVHIIVRIDGTRGEWYDKHWIDVLVRIPFDPDNFLLEKGEKLFEEVKSTLFQLCGAANWGCPTLELEEKVIGPSIIEQSPNAAFSNVVELSLVFEKTKAEGLRYNYTWPVDESTPVYQLLLPSERDTYFGDQHTALAKIRYEVETCISNKNADLYIYAHEAEPAETDQEDKSEISFESQVLSKLDCIPRHIKRSESEVVRQVKASESRIVNEIHRLELVIEKQMEVVRLQSVEILSKLQLHLEFESPKYLYVTDDNNCLQNISTLAFGTSCRLHFLCEDPQGVPHPVENQKGIKINDPPEWFKKAAPVLIPTLRILFFALKIVGVATLGVAIPTPASAFPKGLKEKTIDAVLEKVFQNIDGRLKSTNPSANDFRDASLDKFLKGREDELGLYRAIRNNKIVWLCNKHIR